MLLVTRRIKPEKIYHQIDWPLLVMFVGLFIVVAGIEKVLLTQNTFSLAAQLQLDRTVPLTGFAVLLSNIVSNVPAVLLFKPFLAHLPDARHAWLTLAMASTLGGNLTTLGSVANLIVIERAKRDAPIGFWEYAQVGVAVTVATTAVGACWLATNR